MMKQQIIIKLILLTTLFLLIVNLVFGVPYFYPSEEHECSCDPDSGTGYTIEDNVGADDVHSTEICSSSNSRTITVKECTRDNVCDNSGNDDDYTWTLTGTDRDEKSEYCLSTDSGCGIRGSTMWFNDLIRSTYDGFCCGDDTSDGNEQGGIIGIYTSAEGTQDNRYYFEDRESTICLGNGNSEKADDTAGKIYTRKNSDDNYIDVLSTGYNFRFCDSAGGGVDWTYYQDVSKSDYSVLTTGNRETELANERGFICLKIERTSGTYNAVCTSNSGDSCECVEDYPGAGAEITCGTYGNIGKNCATNSCSYVSFNEVFFECNGNDPPINGNLNGEGDRSRSYGQSVEDYDGRTFNCCANKRWVEDDGQEVTIGFRNNVDDDCDGIVDDDDAGEILPHPTVAQAKSSIFKEYLHYSPNQYISTIELIGFRRLGVNVVGGVYVEKSNGDIEITSLSEAEYPSGNANYYTVSIPINADVENVIIGTLTDGLIEIDTINGLRNSDFDTKIELYNVDTGDVDWEIDLSESDRVINVISHFVPGNNYDLRINGVSEIPIHDVSASLVLEEFYGDNCEIIIFDGETFNAPSEPIGECKRGRETNYCSCPDDFRSTNSVLECGDDANVGLDCNCYRQYETITIGRIDNIGQPCTLNVYYGVSYCPSISQDFDLALFLSQGKTVPLVIKEDVASQKLSISDPPACGDQIMSTELGENCQTCPGDLLDTDNIKIKYRTCDTSSDCRISSYETGSRNYLSRYSASKWDCLLPEGETEKRCYYKGENGDSETPLEICSQQEGNEKYIACKDYGMLACREKYKSEVIGTISGLESSPDSRSNPSSSPRYQQITCSPSSTSPLKLDDGCLIKIKAEPQEEEIEATRFYSEARPGDCVPYIQDRRIHCNAGSSELLKINFVRYATKAKPAEIIEDGIVVDIRYDVGDDACSEGSDSAENYCCPKDEYWVGDEVISEIPLCCPKGWKPANSVIEYDGSNVVCCPTTRAEEETQWTIDYIYSAIVLPEELGVEDRDTWITLYPDDAYEKIRTTDFYHKCVVDSEIAKEFLVTLEQAYCIAGNYKQDWFKKDDVFIECNLKGSDLHFKVYSDDDGEAFRRCNQCLGSYCEIGSVCPEELRERKKIIDFPGDCCDVWANGCLERYTYGCLRKTVNKNDDDIKTFFTNERGCEKDADGYLQC